MNTPKSSQVRKRSSGTNSQTSRLKIVTFDKNGTSKRQKKLTILPEFRKLVDPIVMKLAPENSVSHGEAFKVEQTTELKEKHQIRLEQLEKRLSFEGQVGPFKVWRRKDGKLIIVDGRHDEYRIACKLGLDINYVEFKFNGLDEARSFLIHHSLNHNNFGSCQRMMMVLKLTHVFAAQARKNQGARTDLMISPEKFVPVSTTKELAAIANVGIQ